MSFRPARRRTLTIPEIAAEVKVAERTVKNDWALARDRLGEFLSE